LIHERLDKITRLIDANGMVNASKLAKDFGVSIETIRRDLEYLESKGSLKRVYGGAIANVSKGIERDYTRRETLNIDEKTAIAQKTSELIKDGDTIVMDLGTTPLEVAKCLGGKKDLTVITNCLPVGMELVKNKSTRVFMLGGDLRYGDYSTSGFLSSAGLNNFRVDKAIISASGITIKNGITDYHVEEANVRRKMIDISEQVITVADHTKFGISTFIQVCKLSDVDIIVTDYKVSESVVSSFNGLSTKLIVAPDPNEQ
jgi:DeoR family transcriptional regulator of aga operon